MRVRSVAIRQHNDSIVNGKVVMVLIGAGHAPKQDAASGRISLHGSDWPRPRRLSGPLAILLNGYRLQLLEQFSRLQHNPVCSHVGNQQVTAACGLGVAYHFHPQFRAQGNREGFGKVAE